ncbi:hypothetical protein [Devosia sp.]|uniref:hypothetical protein n=1 Tax=Devosia sp. TaxID=1871048 RepID=UPI003F71D940
MTTAVSDATRRQRIATLSQVTRVAALVIAVALPLAGLTYWGFAPAATLAAAAPVPAAWLAEFGLGQRLLATLLAVLPVLPLSWGLLRLASALEAFRQGRAFGLVAATGMRDFAIGVFTCTLLKLISGALMSVVLSWNAPAGQKQLAISVSSDMLLMLIVGAVLTLVGWALTEAAAIAEENAQFI